MRTKTLFCISLFAMTLYAGQRTTSEKRLLAEKVLRGGTRAATEFDLRAIDSRKMLTLIGHEQLGFAIVSNDDMFPGVIGYSSRPFTSFPPALEWYLMLANREMEEMAASATGYASVLPPAALPDSIGPLLSSTWGQGKPYNRFCPGGNGASGRLYPSGCVATAMSQIMRYHGYPEKGRGHHQYSFQPASGDGRIISADFGEPRYDWSHMLDSYDKAYTDEEADAVALLMLHCGVGVDMQYTASGSGAFGQEACLALKNYFCYNKNARLYTRDYYSRELWMQMIFNEINERQPIYYAGVSGDGGHAFVVDGYNSQGMVHVNWGWDGSSDGFYDIALLNPKSYQFSEAQNMILGICDTTKVIPYESQIVAPEMTFTFYGSSTKRVSVSAQVYNAAAEKFVGKIGCVLENKDTTIVLRSIEDQTLLPIMGGYYSYTPISLPSNNLSTIPDGTYQLYVGSMAEEDTTWQLVRPLEGKVNSYTIVKQGDNVGFSETTSDTWTGIQPAKIGERHHRIYDLMGRRHSDSESLGKGIYIIGGKKVLK